ncbi:hypothetical protein [Saccharomonospora xinjiangensis]|uniref:Uncharacterized protein n=1 Tax=Saccharomonospora xinjiangensis XJ-54 TaxID=882086 RepID=I0V8T6_9PSEU|nr:hypothetical protein [Saccharomonospora xinjiangensis]EID56539.1 hypothetical protein SacxiDRAFT_4358 [Saccharomonospora xinjiangensis XJ-54]
MATKAKVALGVVLIVAGAVLALLFREDEFLWFRGGPLGVVLVVVGVLDLGEALWRARGRAEVERRE